jgi:hypothetical protein
MDNLIVKAILGFAFLMLVLAMALFLPAGSLSFWQAWVYLSVFAGCTIVITAYLAKNDRGLLAGRVQAGPVAESQRTQQINRREIPRYSFAYMHSGFGVSGWRHQAVETAPTFAKSLFSDWIRPARAGSAKAGFGLIRTANSLAGLGTDLCNAVPSTFDDEIELNRYVNATLEAIAGTMATWMSLQESWTAPWSGSTTAGLRCISKCKIEVARCRGQFAHALEYKRNFIVVDSERSQSWNLALFQLAWQ